MTRVILFQKLWFPPMTALGHDRKYISLRRAAPPLTVLGVEEVAGGLQGVADHEAGHRGAWNLGLALS